MCACFCVATGIDNLFHASTQMGISCIKCVLEEFSNQILKNHTRLKFLDIYVSIAYKTDHQLLHLSILHTI